MSLHSLHCSGLTKYLQFKKYYIISSIHPLFAYSYSCSWWSPTVCRCDLCNWWCSAGTSSWWFIGRHQSAQPVWIFLSRRWFLWLIDLSLQCVPFHIVQHPISIPVCHLLELALLLWFDIKPELVYFMQVLPEAAIECPNQNQSFRLLRSQHFDKKNFSRMTLFKIKDGHNSRLMFLFTLSFCKCWISTFP